MAKCHRQTPYQMSQYEWRQLSVLFVSLKRLLAKIRGRVGGKFKFNLKDAMRWWRNKRHRKSRILCEYTTCIIHYNSLRHKNLVQTAVGPKYTSLQTHQDQQPLFAMCLPFSQKISQTSLRSIILLSLNACHGSHHLIVCFNWLKVANCQPWCTLWNSPLDTNNLLSFKFGHLGGHNLGAMEQNIKTESKWHHSLMAHRVDSCN